MDYPEKAMDYAGLCVENDAARAELTETATGIDSDTFTSPVGSTWTIATSLCHLAFWDNRALYLLKQWEKSGSVEQVRLDSQSVDSINEAVNVIALQVPGRAAIALALDSAAAVDGFIAAIGEELADRITAAGFERYLRRSLHRREHLRAIRAALDAQTAKAE